MKEFKPEAILIRLSVERSAARLSETEMRRYQLEKVKNAEMLIDDPEYIPDFTDDLTGDLLEMAWETIKAGIETARKKHFANISGKGKNDSEAHRAPIAPPKATHSPPNTYIHTSIHTYNHSENSMLETNEKETTNNSQNTDETQAPSQSEVIEERKKKKTHFTPPTVEEVREYCRERKNDIDPEHFIDYYERSGWIMGNGQKVKNWKACIRTWEQNRKNGGKTNGGNTGNQRSNTEPTRFDYSFLEE